MNNAVLQAFVKEAIEIEDARGNVSGMVARTIGTLNPNTLIGGAMLAPTGFIRHLKGLDPEQAKALAEAAEGDYGDRVSTTKVRVGGGNLVDDIKRSVTRKDLYLPEKALGVLTAGVAGITAPLGRADHYNPYADTVQSYSGDPGVLAHELGHAADINSYKGGAGAAYRGGRALVGIGSGVAASLLGAPKEVVKAVRGVAVQPLTLLMEAQATRNALKGTALKKELAKQYGAKSIEDGEDQTRNILLPAYGSYVGGAIGSAAALHAIRSGAKVPGAAKLAPLIGIAGGHVAGRTYNAMKRRRAAKARAAE